MKWKAFFIIFKGLSLKQIKRIFLGKWESSFKQTIEIPLDGEYFDILYLKHWENVNVIELLIPTVFDRYIFCYIYMSISIYPYQLSIYQSIYLSIYLSYIYISIYPYIYIYIYIYMRSRNKQKLYISQLQVLQHFYSPDDRKLEVAK